MNLKMRLGEEKDVEALARLYDDINDYFATTYNYPGWKKGVYPTRQDAVDGINEKCLFVATENGPMSILWTQKVEHFLSA